MKKREYLNVALIAVLSVVAMIGLLSEPKETESTGEWLTVLAASKGIGLLALAGIYGVVKGAKGIARKFNEWIGEE